MGQVVVAGIDVGGIRKGFHAVATADQAILAVDRLLSPEDVLEWCRSVSTEVVAVDAPCGWSRDGKSRACERELHGLGVHCYFTPSRELATTNSFYDWVLHGEKLYKQLTRSFQLFDGDTRVHATPSVLETFPHAIAWALAGPRPKNVSKNRFRTKLLGLLGIDTTLLPSADFRDAALCAVTAHANQNGFINTYGSPEEGLIVVPDRQDLFE